MTMNTKQLLLLTSIQVVLAFALYIPQLTNLIQELVHGTEYYDNGMSEAYGIIFKWGVVTMLVFSTVFIGKRNKNEIKFILFSELFLAVLFYKNYNQDRLALTLAFLAISLIVFIIRIPLRKLITNNKILAN